MGPAPMLLACRAQPVCAPISERERLDVTCRARLGAVSGKTRVVKEAMPQPDSRACHRLVRWTARRRYARRQIPSVVATERRIGEAYFEGLSRRSVTIDSCVFADVVNDVGRGSLPPFSTSRSILNGGAETSSRRPIVPAAVPRRGPGHERGPGTTQQQQTRWGAQVVALDSSDRLAQGAANDPLPVQPTLRREW
jgi:hypothetical protein